MSSTPERTAAGEAFYLRVDDGAGVGEYLRRRGWINDDDEIHAIAPAGDGNMNCTIRVVAGTRRLVVKQGRPWVERYPSIPAPAGRTLIEAAFYELVAPIPALAERMPRLVGVDREHSVLVMNDCVGFADLTGLYTGESLDPALLDALLAYLAALHRLPLGEAGVAPWANDEMRALNHAYIFALPLAVDAAAASRLDGVTSGLAECAAKLAGQATYVAAVARLGQRYLRGPARGLVHGDYFPGSWLAQGLNLRVIDPEFCFGGAPEFDYGVMAAHLVLAAQDTALVQRVARAAAAEGLDAALVAGFAGVEMMRRLIGVAQLPRLERSLATKTALLDHSRRLVLGLEPIEATRQYDRWS